MKTSLGAFAIACFLSTYGYPTFAQAAPISVDEVEASLKAGHPKSTLPLYFNCENYQGSAYEAIASGSADWISLAERMLQYSDACYSEGIQAALGRAMQKSPQNVLPLVNKTTTLEAAAICLPFISNELPIKSQLKEIARSRQAIRKIRDVRLRIQKTSCLNFIKMVEVNLLQQPSIEQQSKPVPHASPSPAVETSKSK